MALLNVTPYDREVYEKNLSGYLPSRFIDCHNHVWLKQFVTGHTAASRSCAWPEMVAEDNSVEDLLETNRELFPGKEVIPVLYSYVNIAVDPVQSNLYVREKAAQYQLPALYLSRPEQPAEEVEKAVLEGGVAARPANTLIYATSNRRHLVRETFADREGDEVHRGDSIQESLSLADRFGLAVNFSQPDKAHFLEIVRQLAAQRGLQDHWAEMEKGAEIWAIARGGRSPRCARQYVDAFAVKLQLETSLGQHC